MPFIFDLQKGINQQCKQGSSAEFIVVFSEGAGAEVKN